MTRKTQVEAAYVGEARTFILSRLAKNEAVRMEDKARKACAKAMFEAGVKAFNFEVEYKGNNLSYSAALERHDSVRVNCRKLYNLVKTNEISLDDFLDIVTASQSDVEALLGQASAQRVLSTIQKPIELYVTKR